MVVTFHPRDFQGKIRVLSDISDHLQMTLECLPLTPDGQVRPFWKARRLYLLMISILEVKTKNLGHFWGLELVKIVKNTQNY